MGQVAQEAERIQRVYKAYAQSGSQYKWSLENPGNLAIISERTRVLGEMLQRMGFLMALKNLSILEVGCAGGRVIQELITLGACPRSISGVDLRSDGIESARCRWPEADLRVADAQCLPFDAESFDIVVTFTVFSSILDHEIAKGVANEVRRVLKPTGAIIYYDFQYNNPWNVQVRGIKRREVKALFPHFRIEACRALTLFPPLARRFGRFTSMLYPALATLPFVRTHLMAILTSRGSRPRS